MKKAKIRWAYLAEQAENPPTIELNCTVAELAEARKELSNDQFAVWVNEVSSDASHDEAMEWARRW